MKNHDYTDLAIAFGSILFITTILPICDSISGLITSAINKTINKMNIDMQLDQAEGQAAAEVISPNVSCTNAIGFEIPSVEEFEEEDDDYE